MLLKDRIKQIREHFGLSQARFAQRINKSPGFIALVETGRSNVSDETIETICSEFPINEAWLRNGEGMMTDEAPVDLKNIGIRLKQMRKDMKLTQDQFAAATGYTSTQIYFVESGKVNPSDKFLRRVSEAFDVSFEWLMTGTGEMHGVHEDRVDENLLEWLNKHPEVIRELRRRSGLDT